MLCIIFCFIFLIIFLTIAKYFLHHFVPLAFHQIQISKVFFTIILDDRSLELLFYVMGVDFVELVTLLLTVFLFGEEVDWFRVNEGGRGWWMVVVTGGWLWFLIRRSGINRQSPPSLLSDRMYRMFQPNILRLTILQDLILRSSIMFGYGGVLDITFPLQIFYLVLVHFSKRWRLLHNFINVLTIGESGVVERGLGSPGTGLFLQHLCDLEVVDILLDWVHFLHDQRNLLYRLWGVLLCLRNDLIAIWIVDRWPTIHPVICETDFWVEGHFSFYQSFNFINF